MLKFKKKIKDKLYPITDILLAILAKRKKGIIITVCIFFTIGIIYVIFSPVSYIAFTIVTLKKIQIYGSDVKTSAALSNKISTSVIRNQQLRELTSLSSVSKAIMESGSAIEMDNTGDLINIMLLENNLINDLNFDFKGIDKNRFEIDFEERKIFYKYDQPFNLSKCRLVVRKSEGSFFSAHSAIKIISQAFITKQIQDGLKVIFPHPDSNQLQLSLKMNDKETARRALFALKTNYEANKSGNEPVDTAIGFISKKIDSVGSVLAKLKNHAKNGFNDLQHNGELIIQPVKLNKEELQKQAAILDLLKSYVKIPYQQFSVIPTTFGFAGNSSLELLIDQLNDNQADRQKLLAETRPNADSVKKLNQLSVILKNSAITKIDSLNSKIGDRLKNSSRSHESISGNSTRISAENLKMQQQGSLQLYLYLLHKREAIQNAIPKLPDTSNIDATVRVVRESKHTPLILVVSILLGIICPLTFFSIKRSGEKLGHHEISIAIGIPLIGVFDHYKRDNEVIWPIEYDTAIGLQLNQIAFHLQKSVKNKVIVFTSAKAGEGKSFLAKNIAVAIASGGKSVILIQSGLNSMGGNLAGSYTAKTLKGYLKTTDNAESVVSNSAVKNLFLIEADNVNSLTFLKNKRGKLLIEYLKANYDYIILDTESVQQSNLMTLLKIAHLTFINIISTSVENRSYLSSLNSLLSVNRKADSYLLINDLQ